MRAYPQRGMEPARIAKTARSSRSRIDRLRNALTAGITVITAGSSRPMTRFRPFFPLSHPNISDLSSFPPLGRTPTVGRSRWIVLKRMDPSGCSLPRRRIFPYAAGCISSRIARRESPSRPAGTDPAISRAERTRLRGIRGANRTCPTWEARPAILEARFSILEGAHMLAFVPLRPAKTSASPSPWSSNEPRAPSGTHLATRTRGHSRTLAVS